MFSKPCPRYRIIPSVALLAGLGLVSAGVQAQESRITKSVNSQERAILTGHIHPKARPENDRGRVAPSMPLSYVTLMLGRSTAQQADLEMLLATQQDPSSPNYHHWISPEEYAQRFGVSQEDLDKITGWLQGQGLKIAAMARARNWVAVDGEASAVEGAFQTEIHEYVVNGETHFANASEPSIPAAFGGVIAAIRGLNDFRMKPRLRKRASAVSENSLTPRFSDGQGNNFLAPGDFAIIYDGQTQVQLSDIQTFRSNYGLPANNPQLLLVPGAQDPGVSQDDLPEADLDIEWSGGVAKNAKVIFVYSTDVMVSTQYAVDQALAPVISQSYGLCELETPQSDAASMRAIAQQANAEGVTWMAASGDTGAADCGDSQNPGLSVDAPGSVPEVTDVGGTEFQEAGGKYWSATNSASGVSALSYIPETSWNDSVEDGSPSSSGGGVSVYFTKPSWQTGRGVPGNNARNVPDLSFNASADHDGYFVQTGGQLDIYGGTSVSVQVFAGITALLNQYVVSTKTQSSPGLGNMNVKLYSLAGSASSAFHDVTTGNNIVTTPCTSRSCSNTPVGYDAGPGFDLVTGWGSVDVAKLFTAWAGGSFNTGTGPSSTSMTLTSNLNDVSSADTVFLIASVTGANGTTPTGTVQFSLSGVTIGSAPLEGSGGVATATLAVNGNQLPRGAGTITASYEAGGSASVTASVSVSVSSTGSGSGVTPSVVGIANGASYQHTYAPGMILSVFGTELAPTVESASSVPLPVVMSGVAATVNGVAAPLYYVSPNQLNIQIPYQTPANAQVLLTVNNNGVVTSFPFAVSTVAPGIFTTQAGAIVPNPNASRGQVISLYFTGGGAVSPQIASGAAPANGTFTADLPVPAQNVAVVVGGIEAPAEFVGIPPGLVGVVQVNFEVPGNAPVGVQPVAVYVGGVPSAAGSLTIN